MNFRGVGPIDQVLFGQLQRAGDQGCADFMQRGGADPVLPPAAQNQHDHRSFANAVGLKKVGSLIGQAADIGKGKTLFLPVIVAPDQRQLVRLPAGPFVHNIKAEIKVGGDVAAVILFKILVGIKFNSGQISV